MFILIDNAIKYSQNNQDIEIQIDDLEYNKTKIKVISFSPYLTPAERVNIFEKRYCLSWMIFKNNYKRL